MTDESMLNQDDIDALMNSFQDTKGAPSSHSRTPSIDPESLRAPTEHFASQASTVIATVLNRSCDLSVSNIDECTENTIWKEGEKFLEDALYVKIPFSQGVTGDLYIFIAKKSTAILADLMMMGDGSAPFEEDHKDALGELTNQIVGAFNTSLGTELGSSFISGQATIGVLDPQAMPFAIGNGVHAKIKLKIQDQPDDELLLVYTEELVKGFSSFYTDKQTETTSSRSSATKPSSLAPIAEDTEELEEMRPTRSSLFASSGNPNIDMLLDIPLDVTIELGRAEMSIRKILEIGPGAIVELDHKASEPVDLLINDKVVARGEVVVVDEYFGIRIVSLLSPEERIKQLR